MKLLFLHGWAFDATMWQALAERLSGHETLFDERGYFGGQVAPARENGPCVVIAHSLGVMRALHELPPGCLGLIAINGFDRFTANGASPGLAPRILDRMIARLADDPCDVVAQFRHLCGSSEPFGKPHFGRLRDDLLFLRDGDCREVSSQTRFPVLALHGGSDPVVTPAMRDAAFAGARNAETAAHPQGGHLLPVEAPDWCATHIRRFIEKLS